MIFVIYGMIYAGSALMVYNIICFIRFANKEASEKASKKEKRFFYIPIGLLIMFLLGYLAVGIFGKPDIIVSGILFGGSIFVFIMYRVLFNITKQIQKQEKLKSQLLISEESNRSKTQFLSTVSHEMRTPLNVIIGLDTIALKNENIDETTKDYLERIGMSAKHLLGLINNVLDINSIESGNLNIKKIEFDFLDVIGQVNSKLSSMCSEKGLTYEHYCDESLTGNYLGDEMRIKQILFNLLDNAVKYTNSPGTVTLRIEKCDSIGERIKFVVQDTGIGMSEEFLPKIFTVLTREDQSTTSDYGGSGLGLAVTKDIVEILGGTIEVESKKNVGTIFTIILPMEKANTVEGEEDEISLEGKRVLVVEDIVENAEIVSDLLELEGVESEHALNGKMALDMFSSSADYYYDAILMDLRMPEMDGLTATQEIRKLTRVDAKTTPIIALSANAFESDIKESFKVGMNAHIPKPADANVLYSTLKKCIKEATKEKTLC